MENILKRQEYHPSVDSCKSFGKVIDKLYIGSAEAAEDTEFLKSCQIRAIIALGTGKIAKMDIPHLCIDILDLEESFIMKYFQECFDFLNLYINNKNMAVLVHCAYGQSRSATICIAYLLSLQPKSSIQKAYSIVQLSRPCIYINHGFLKQLNLFSNMGGRIMGYSNDHAKFRNLWSFNEWKNNGASLVFPPLSSEEMKPTKKYYCKSCNEYLFDYENIVLHSVNKNTNNVKSFKEKSLPSNYYVNHVNVKDCGVVFIEPLVRLLSKTKEWVEKDKGKIYCPRMTCSVKLGSWNWNGIKCSCSHFLRPAFQIRDCKIEKR